MSFRSFLLRVLAVVLVLFLLLVLWAFRDTWLLIFLAVVIAVGISIPMSYLQRLGLPRPLALTLAAIGVGATALGLGLWLVPALTVEFGRLLARLPQVARNLVLLYGDVRAQSDFWGEVLPPFSVQQLDLSALSPTRVQALVNQALETGVPVLVTGGGFVATLLTNLLLVVLIAIFLLVDPKSYIRASLYLTPRGYQGRLLELWSLAYHTLRTWLSTLLISISITAFLVWSILGALGMPNVLVVAVFSGVATFVPNIGLVLPLIPITVFTLAFNPSLWPTMVVAYLVIQFVESNILTPSIVRRQLHIPPAATLTFQILAALTFGLLGILLAVPLLALTITLVRELYSYDLLGLRGARAEVTLPPPPPHAKDTRLSRRAGALQGNLQKIRRIRVHKAREPDGRRPAPQSAPQLPEDSREPNESPDR